MMQMRNQKFMEAYYYGIKDGEQLVAVLEELKDRGYRFVTRDDDTHIMVWSERPKRYRNTGWGYKPSDLVTKRCFPAMPVESDLDIVKKKDRYAYNLIQLIEDLKGEE